MATSTLYQSSPLASPSVNPGSCFYMPRQPHLQPKADWRASFTSTNNENREASPFHPLLGTKPLILRQHNGVWLPRQGETPLDNPSKPQPQSPHKETVAEDTVSSPSKSRLSLGRVAKVLRCHVCLSTVKEQHFRNHLLFGAVRCELCLITCQDCRVFEWLSEEAELESNKCEHKFVYCEDPFKYLLPRLCGSDDSELDGSSSLPHNLRVLQNYVKKLSSLQLREPWSDAIRKCNSHLLRAYKTPTSEPARDVSAQGNSLPSTSRVSDASSSLKDPPHISKSSDEVTSQSNPPTACAKEDGMGVNLCGESEGLSSRIKAILGSSQCPSSARQNAEEKEDLDDGLLLTQTYDLKHLEQEVEYVELEEHNTTPQAVCVEDKPNPLSKPKKRRKLSHKKPQRLTPQPKKRTQSLPPVEQGQEKQEEEEEEEDLVMEQVEFPENGYYLMVRGAVEECPMCYEPFDPSMCTVNIRIFLFTVHCPKCSLVIYMVPDIPDGLKIVTEDSTNGAVSVHSEPAKSKTKPRKTHPRDFFAR